MRGSEAIKKKTEKGGMHYARFTLVTWQLT